METVFLILTYNGKDVKTFEINLKEGYYAWLLHDKLCGILDDYLSEATKTIDEEFLNNFIDFFKCGFSEIDTISETENIYKYKLTDKMFLIKLFVSSDVCMRLLYYKFFNGSFWIFDSTCFRILTDKSLFPSKYYSFSEMPNILDEISDLNREISYRFPTQPLEAERELLSTIRAKLLYALESTKQEINRVDNLIDKKLEERKTE